MLYDERAGKKTVNDFIKAFSCSYSITMNLGTVLGVDVDDILLSSVIGFGSGVSTMGDTCGAVNGAIVVLGKRFEDLPSPLFYSLCSAYYRRLEEQIGTPDCGKVHGGKHLASDFRRAILTGKTRQCVRILRHGSEILATLARQVEEGDVSCIGEGQHDCGGIEEMARYFEHQSFHCCRSTVAEIAGRSGMPVEHIMGPSRGFCGGIGFNGTLCGAVVGGVLCLGSTAGVNLSNSGYGDTLRIVVHGLLKSDGVFRDEKRFPPAKLYKQCQKVYRTVEERFGAADCRSILGLTLQTSDGARQYIANDRIHLCREIVRTVADTAASVQHYS